MTDMQPIQGQGEVILYQTDDGQAKINLKAIDGSVWFTQLELAELFVATKQNISLHIKNILKDGELVEASVVKESLTTEADGKNYKTKLFSLPMILAIGYRVRSPRGTLHVGWAVKPINRRLRWASLAFSPSYVGLREASR